MLSSEGWRPGRLVPLNSLLGATNELQRENGCVFDIYSLHDGGDAKYQFPGTLKKSRCRISPLLAKALRLQRLQELSQCKFSHSESYHVR